MEHQAPRPELVRWGRATGLITAHDAHAQQVVVSHEAMRESLTGLKPLAQRIIHAVEPTLRHVHIETSVSHVGPSAFDLQFDAVRHRDLSRRRRFLTRARERDVHDALDRGSSAVWSVVEALCIMADTDDLRLRLVPALDHRLVEILGRSPVPRLLIGPDVLDLARDPDVQAAAASALAPMNGPEIAYFTFSGEVQRTRGMLNSVVPVGDGLRQFVRERRVNVPFDMQSV